MASDPSGKLFRTAKLAQSFTPALPVREVDLFAGRHEQVMDCVSALFQPGLHVAVYGERGVGKTSLSNVLPQMVRATQLPSMIAGRVDCNTNDHFDSLWRKVFREIGEEWNDEEDGLIDPESVRFRLGRDQKTRLLVIDELDRLEDDETLSLLADTLKTLSDHFVSTTIMLVGVASSIGGLIGEHASIVRSISQIQMPRMQPDELLAILDRGFGEAGMTVESDARAAMATMSEGLPHFVHLLGLHSGRTAASEDETRVTMDHVQKAMVVATRSHTILTEYHRATMSPQAGHLFEEVVLACAFAQKDDLGYFRAADVRGPLSMILNRTVEIPAFARHLNELSSETRGYTLQKEGVPRHFRYRFSNPLLEPFARMVGATKGRLPEFLWAMMQRLPESPGPPEWPSGWLPRPGR